MKRYQCERRVVFEYVAADVKWKEQHCELEHVRNNRKFRKINEFCYEVHNRWLNGIWRDVPCVRAIEKARPGPNSIGPPSNRSLHRKCLKACGWILWTLDLGKTRTCAGYVISNRQSSKFQCGGWDAKQISTHRRWMFRNIHCEFRRSWDSSMRQRHIKEAALIFLKSYGARVVNGWSRTPRPQGSVEQANGVMEDKLKITVEATRNLR